LHPEDNPSGGGTEPPITTASHYKPEFTALEKMGFIMGGHSSPMRRTEDLLTQIRDRLPPKANTPLIPYMPDFYTPAYNMV
jgi:hypothetical protein